jgi:hypothetical protein
VDIVVAEVVPDTLGADFERPADQTNPKVLRVLAFLALDVGLV